MRRMSSGAKARTSREYWQRRRLAAVFLFAIVALAMLSLRPGAAGADTSYDSEEKQFLELINAYRADNGAGPLTLSEDLTVSSEYHNEDMAEYNFFAHDTAESSHYPTGSQPWDRMSAEGYDYNTYKGENLAAGYETAEEAFQAWKDSPSHNTAMLDGNYKVIGISRIDVPGSAFGWYWTTDFGGLVDSSVRQPEADTPEPAPDPAPEPERAGENHIENGVFADRSDWRQRALDGAELILAGEFARLGDYNDGVDELSQEVRIPEDGTLSYDVKVSSAEDKSSDDTLRVRLTDEDREPVALLKSYTGEDEGGWRREKVDLSRYAGKTLNLSFFARTDEERHTSFYLDNVHLIG